jgi:hypothetical protein
MNPIDSFFFSLFAESGTEHQQNGPGFNPAKLKAPFTIAKNDVRSPLLVLTAQNKPSAAGCKYERTGEHERVYAESGKKSRFEIITTAAKNNKTKAKIARARNLTSLSKKKSSCL